MFQKISGIEKSGKGVKYSPELRSFALTLHFYSVKAYNFVRKNFKLCLPHPNVISQWYSKIPAEPGFTKPSFDALSLKLKSAEKNGKRILCSLMLDEMSIKKFISYDGKQYHGYVDIGDGNDDDDSRVEKLWSSWWLQLMVHGKCL